MEIACSAPARLRGLIGRRDFTDVLLLTPCNDVHTFGMKRPIDIAFISHDGFVFESYRAVVPHRRVRCKKASATLERFSSDSPWFEPGGYVDLKHPLLETFTARTALGREERNSRQQSFEGKDETRS